MKVDHKKSRKDTEDTAESISPEDSEETTDRLDSNQEEQISECIEENKEPSIKEEDRILNLGKKSCSFQIM